MPLEVFLMRSFSRLFVALSLAIGCSTHVASAADSTNMNTTMPKELAALLKSKSAKPLLLYVGPHMLYTQAHIPGSDYIGMGSTPQGLQNLVKRVSALPKNQPIVLYCGCCPWSHCPNVNPAYDALTKLGFTRVNVLYLANNFGTDWVEKGYPTDKGE